MPLTIFANSTHTEGAKEFLENLGFEITGNLEKWTATFEARDGLFRKKRKMSLHYDLEYCSPPAWTEQIAGMMGFFSEFPIPEENREKIMRMIQSFRSTIGIILEPEPKDYRDPRFAIAGDLAAHLDGVVFLPSGVLVDPHFATLIDPDGETESTAKFPEIPESNDELLQVANADEEEEEFELNPPSPDRVVARLHALAAVAARGLIDMNLRQGNRPAFSVQHISDWVDQVGVGAELESTEERLLRIPEGKLSEEDVLNAVWRIEGLGVLAWALKLCPLPAYDQTVATDDLLAAVGFAKDPDWAMKIRTRPELQAAAELEKYNNQIFAHHWRMVDFRVRSGAVDFKKMETDCWFGPLDLSWATFCGNDLALGEKAILEADPDLIKTVSSIASERHLASNWLKGQTPVYSEVDTST